MRAHRAVLAGLVVAVADLAGCRLGPTFGNIPISEPTPTPASAPSISSLAPASVTAGGAGFTLSVNGSGFSSGAVVQWINPGNPGFIGGTATFVSSTQLTLQISAANIAIPGPVQVKVLTTNAADSNPATFVIHPAAAGGAQLISTGASGATANGNSHNPVLSFNGRFVAFSSEATNLVVPGTNFAEAYVRDTCLGADGCTPSTLLASAENGGPADSPTEGNGLGGTPSIALQGFFPPSGAGTPSAGRFIGFLSTANNLILSGTAFQQAYMRDTCFGAASAPGCTPTTLLASVKEISGEPNGAASEYVLASNSCNAAFVSAGTNLVNGVTIPNQVYESTCGGPVFDFTNTTLVSAGALGNAGDQGGHQPAISSNGLFVAFASTSTNLTSTPNGGNQQIYVRFTCQSAGPNCTPSTTMVSVDNAGNALSGSSQLAAISDDGRFVAFSTQTPAPGGGITSDVFLHDTCNSSAGMVTGCTPSTTTISVAAGGGTANGPSSSSAHAVSGDGRLVVFSSSATNLVSGGNPAAQVFVRDTCKSSGQSVSGCTPGTVLISIGSGGPIGGLNAAISNDGHFVAFENEASIFQIFVTATGF
jgi:hypothetical protein